MRQLTKLLLTLGLAVVFVSLSLAQGGRPGGGGFQITESTILAVKSVQEELKLTDAQKEKLTKFGEKLAADRQEAFKGGGKGKFDKEAFAKMAEETTKATNEFVKAELKPEQAKRLKQITLQAAVQFGGPSVFSREDVQKDLKLTDKQQEAIKTIAADTQKDAKEIRDNAGQDKEKQTAAREKTAALNKEAIDKVSASLTAEQKTAWKDLLGDKFEIKREDLQFGRPGGGNFGKDKAKKTDK